MAAPLLLSGIEMTLNKASSFMPALLGQLLRPLNDKPLKLQDDPILPRALIGRSTLVDALYKVRADGDYELSGDALGHTESLLGNLQEILPKNIPIVFPKPIFWED
jgi:hypothetical protein